MNKRNTQYALNTQYSILNTNKRGAALLLTFIVMITLVTITVIFLYALSVRLKSAASDTVSIKAFWLAEAGLAHYTYLLSTEFDYRKNFPDLATQYLGDGTYEVNVTRDGYAYTLTSSGTAGTITRTVQQTVDVLDAFCFAMHSFGSQTNFKGSVGTIDGNVAARLHIQDEDGITIINGTFTENSPVPSPSPVDFAAYRSIADYIMPAGYEFATGTYGAAGDEKIWYIEGNTTIDNNVTIYGSIIAEGNVAVAKTNPTGIIIDAASNYPALISGGNINLDKLTNSTINGLIYADNNFDLDNADEITITGAILSGNNTHIRKSKNFTISYELEAPPPFFSGYDPVVIPRKDWGEI